MTNVTATSGVSAPAAPQSISGAGGADFNMFLKLLTTQMQHQDPLDPMDTSQYTQQLVAYSQVEQSMQQTGLLRDLLARMSSSDFAQAAGLIGREAEFDSSVGALGSGPATWSWSIARKADAVTAEVVNASGKAVATVPLDHAAMRGSFSWDGRLADGSRAPDGAYALKISARDSAGSNISSTVHSVGKVREVVQREGELWLDIGGASLPMTDLLRVAAAPAVA